MNRFGVAAILILLIGLGFAAVASDSLQTADSLRDAQAQFPLWSDSALVRSDSLGNGHNAADRWLLPLGVIVLAGASAWLLFSVRSK
jgi:hypothetical protein